MALKIIGFDGYHEANITSDGEYNFYHNIKFNFIKHMLNLISRNFKIERTKS